MSEKEKIQLLMVTYSLMFEFLETICWDKSAFIRPDEGTILQYKYLRYVAADCSIDKFGQIDPFEYPDFHESNETICRRWHDFAPKLFPVVQSIQREFKRLKCNVNNIMLPRKVVILASGIRSTIEWYKKEKASIRAYKDLKDDQRESTNLIYRCDDAMSAYIAGDLDHVMKFRKNSVLFKIIRQLDKVKPEYLEAKKIAQRVGNTLLYVEHAIANLRRRIETSPQIAGRLRIDHQKGQGYKLTPLMN